jgi:lysophospholipase L1-like esterase
MPVLVATLDPTGLSDTGPATAHGELGTTGWKASVGSTFSISSGTLLNDSGHTGATLYCPDAAVCREGWIEAEFVPNDSFNAGGSQTWGITARYDPFAPISDRIDGMIYKITDTLIRMQIQLFKHGSGAETIELNWWAEVPEITWNPAHRHLLRLKTTGVFPTTITFTIRDLTDAVDVAEIELDDSYNAFQQEGYFCVQSYQSPSVDIPWLLVRVYSGDGDVSDPYPAGSVWVGWSGDSNSQFEPAGATAHRALPEVVADEYFTLTGKRMLLTNHSFFGKDTTDYAPAGTLLENFKTMMAVRDCTHAVVALGTNDTWAAKSGTRSAAQFNTRTQAIVDDLTSDGLKVMLVECPAIDSVAFGGGTFDATSETLIQAYPAEQDDVASGDPTNVIVSHGPLATTLATPALLSDGVHYTAAGHDAVAPDIAEDFSDAFDDTALSVTAGVDDATVDDTNATLSATPSGGAGSNTYAWTATVKPSGSNPSFNATAQNPVVTFDKAGSYTFSVTVTDAEDTEATDTVDVTVNQTATSLEAPDRSVSPTESITLLATVYDQFEDALTVQPAIVYALVSGPADDSLSTATYTAGSDVPETAVYSATSGALTDNGTIHIREPSNSANTGQPLQLPSLSLRGL